MLSKSRNRRQDIKALKMVGYGVLFAFIAMFTTISSRASDPSGFTNVDVGSSLGYGFTAGSDSYDSTTGVLTVTGSGFGPTFGFGDIGDQFHMTYATVAATSPNFRLIAEITSITPSSGVAPQVGLIVRQGTTNPDDEGGVLYAPLAGDGYTANEFEPFCIDTNTLDGNPAPEYGWIPNAIGTPITFPFWLELIKTGNTFAVYRSADGLNWAMIDSYSGGAYSQSGSMDVGFVVCGGYNSATSTDYPAATAKISNISLNTSPALSYETSWVGDSLDGDYTGHVASLVSAMWVDSSGDCFTNFTAGTENNTSPCEFKGGEFTAGLGTEYANLVAVQGDGSEGSITGDNAGNIYWWGTNSSNSTYGLYKSSTSTPYTLEALATTSSISLATGMAWDASSSLLYVSDPTTSEILAMNPATQGSSQEDTTADFSFAQGRPGPMTIDGSGNLWIIQEGNAPGTGTNQPLGTPCTNYPAAVYCYKPGSTGATQQAMQISGVNDTTKVYQVEPITGATNGQPIVITTPSTNEQADGTNGLATGDIVTIAGVEGNTAANNTTSNPTWTITEITPTTFSLNGSNGTSSGAYTCGGNVSFPAGVTVGWDPTAIAYDNSAGNNRLLVTDDGPDQNVKIFNLTNWTTGTKSTPDATYGETGGLFSGATPGLLTDSSGDSARFYGPTGVGTDSSGNIYVAENYNYSKSNLMSDIRSLTSTGDLNWDLAGLTWTDCGGFDPQTGDIYTTNQHEKMNYAVGSGAEWSQYSFLWDPFVQAVVPGDLGEDCVEARRIDGSLFLFADGQSPVGQINIYRMNGEQMVPCGGVSGFYNGTISETNVWSDLNDDGIQDTNEVTAFSPADSANIEGFDVDSNGNIWLAEGTGTPLTSTAVEILLQSITNGVPIYSVAAPSDYNTYSVPAPFSSNWSPSVWPQLRYIASTNTMYLMGFTYESPDFDSEQATIERVNNFTTNPTVAWTIVTQIPDDAPADFMSWYGNFQYNGLDVENDKVFVPEQWGPIHVYDANTGAPITVFNAGPEISGFTAFDDCYMGMHAYYNPATNEYDVAEENSGDSGRQNFYRWSPFTGAPNVQAFTVTAATDASPIKVTTSVANGLVNGQQVVVSGVEGNTAANGTWTVTKVSSKVVELDGSSGNATYTSGGTMNVFPYPSDADIDAPADAGSADQTSGTYTVNGGGAGYGLSGGVDQFNLCWAQMDGNGSLSAQVVGLSGSSAAAASAGLMIRNGIATAGTQSDVTLAVTNSNGLVFQFKPTSAGTTTTVATLSGITPSSGEYIMLVRSTSKSAGDTFAAYYSLASTGGTDWTQLGSTVSGSGTGYKIVDGFVTFTTPMALTAYAGFAVTAANNSSLATGTFDRELLAHTHLITPPAPTGLDVTSENGGVGVSWQASTSAEQYNIYRGTVSGGETLLASAVGNPWTDSSVANGTTYYYEVTAIGPGGESTKSSENSVVYQNWNPSFEWQVYLNNGTYGVNPPDDAWTFDDYENAVYNYSGVAVNSAGWTNIPAPNGVQYAFIVDDGEISQTLTGFQSNKTYTVTFEAAQSSYTNGPNALEVTMDGTPVSVTTGGNPVSNPVEPPSDTAYTLYSFQFVTASNDPGSHTLAFTGTNPGGGFTDPVVLDNIVFSPGL